MALKIYEKKLPIFERFEMCRRKSASGDICGIKIRRTQNWLILKGKKWFIYGKWIYRRIKKFKNYFTFFGGILTMKCGNNNEKKGNGKNGKWMGMGIESFWD